MALAERGDALARLAGLLTGAVAGSGGTALVSGPVAVGKTALIDAFAAQARTAGVITLTAVATPAEKDCSLGVIGQLMRAAPASEPAGLVRRLVTAPAGLAEPGGERAHLVAAGLLDLAERQPVVIVVDDVQHADPASLACLAYLSRRIRSARVAALFSHSGRAPLQHTDFWLEIQRLPGGVPVTLRPLSVSGVRELLVARLGETAAGLAPACLAATGGSPLLAAALAEDLVQILPALTIPSQVNPVLTDLARVVPAQLNPALAGVTAASPLPAGDCFRQAVLACLRRCGPEPLAVARAVAVLGTPGLAGPLLRFDAVAMTHALDALAGAGLLDAGAFRHSAAQSAVLADLPQPDRAALHRRAAELTRAGGAPAAVVAGHLQAARDVRPVWAAEVLERAARDELAHGRVASAVAFGQLACQSEASAATLARIRTTLLRAEWRIRLGAPTPQLTLLLDALRRGHLDDRGALVLARALLWQGRDAEAREALGQLAALAQPVDPGLAAELRAVRAWVRYSYPPVLGSLPGPSDGGPPPAVVGGPRLDAPAVLDLALAARPAAHLAAGAEGILRRALAADTSLETMEFALLALLYGGHTQQAATWCDELTRQCRQREAPGRAARLAALRAEISLRTGDLAAAERHARHAQELIPAESWGVVIGGLLGVLILALTAMGRPDEAARELGTPVPPTMLHSRYGLHYLHARGRWNLASGDLDAALADLRQCGHLMRSWDLDVPALIPWRSDAAEVLLRLGDQPAARTLAREQCDRGGPHHPWARGSATRVLAATYAPPRRAALLREAVNLLQRSGDRYELARALTSLAETYQTLGDLPRARSVGLRARTLAGECQAGPLGQAAGPPSGPAAPGPVAVTIATAAQDLSDAERRVASLAALGYTNREIARRLYITVGTVEQHLTSTYRKLHVRRRTDLPVGLIPAGAVT